MEIERWGGGQKIPNHIIGHSERRIEICILREKKKHRVMEEHIKMDTCRWLDTYPSKIKTKIPATFLCSICRLVTTTELTGRES
jgi:hypothetical protein